MASGSTRAPTSVALPDVRRVLVGNWVGAGLTALTALTIAALLSGIMALLAKPADFGLWNTLTLAMTIMAGSFGADLVGTLTEAGTTGDIYLGFFPLTVTIASLAGAVWVFRNTVSRYPGPAPAVGDAARAAALFAIPLMIGSLIFHSDNDELGRGWGAELSEGVLGARADVGPSAVGALFLGFLILFATLALTAVVSVRQWSPRTRRVHDWLGAPLMGIATLFALLPLAGLAGLLLMVFGEDTITGNDPSNDTLALITVIFGGLASGGAWLIGLGAGSSLGYRVEAFGEPPDSDWQHLWGSVTEDEPGLWAAPLVMILVLGLSAYVVARRSPTKNSVLRDLAAWVALLLVAVPLLVRLSGLHAGGRVTSADVGINEAEARMFAGLHGVQSTLLLLLAALVIAFFVALLTGALDAAHLRARAGSFARSVQSDPGAPAGSGQPAAPGAPQEHSTTGSEPVRPGDAG